jgi:hypothetical protein
MFFLAAWLRAREVRVISAVAHGRRRSSDSAAHRSGRRAACCPRALIASAAFIIVAVDAFRQAAATIRPIGGRNWRLRVLLAKSELPIVQNPVL